MEGIDLKIEESRQAFMALYKKQRLLNNIALIVVVSLIIAAYVILQAWLNINYAAIAAVAGILVLLFVYSRISRSKMEKTTKEYIHQYYDLMKDKVFSQDRFSNATMDFEQKLDLNVFTDAGILQDIVRINSRGVITSTYQGQNVVISDLAAYKLADGKQTPSFLGKFIIHPISLSFSGRLLVYLKPKIPANGPNALDDVKKIDETDRWVIYGSEATSKKMLSSKFMQQLESLDIDDLLMDAVFSIQSNVIKVALSYTDALMVIPLQNPFDPKPSDHYKKDLTTVIAAIDSLK